MANSPFFRLPFYNYYPGYYPNYTTNAKKENTEDKSSVSAQRRSNSYSFGPLHFKNPFFYDIEEPVFEMFGIQLYLDDIIILGLLFFLYKEGVQDEMLFISLILLLLS